MKTNAVYQIEKCYYAKKNRYVYVPLIKENGMFGREHWYYILASKYINAIKCNIIMYELSDKSPYFCAGSSFEDAIEILKEVKRIDESRKKQHETTVYLLDENFNTIEEKTNDGSTKRT